MKHVQDYIRRFWPACQQAQASNQIPALFTLAQGALESGWAAQAPGNNLFGIKAGTGWVGERRLLATEEVHDHPARYRGHYLEVLRVAPESPGRWRYYVRDWFRAYPSLAEGIADHGRFLQENGRYAACFTETTPEGFARAVAAAGYATAPGYAIALIAVMNTIRAFWPTEIGPKP
jgi:flagellum-specific peptidoglycan hydrolase FlgJ